MNLMEDFWPCMRDTCLPAIALAPPPSASPPRPVPARDGQANAGRAQARQAGMWPYTIEEER